MSQARITEATYRIEIRDRVTEETLCRIDRGNGNFSRVLDGISSAEWIIPGDCSACDCKIKERAHELAFIREDWEEPAWIGPIVRVVDDSSQGTIRFNAVDRLYWLEGSPADRDILFQSPNEISVVNLVELLLSTAERYEVLNLQRLFKGSSLPPDIGLLTESKIFEGESVWGKMIALAKSVLDFTVVGEQLYWGSPEIPIVPGPEIIQSYFTADPLLDRDAESVVTQVVVIAAGGVRGVWPPVGEEKDLGYGKRTEFVSDTNLNTEKEATNRARELFELNIQPTTFIVTGDGSLSPNFPLPLHELVPGRNFPVRAKGQCLEASEDVKQLFNLIVEIREEADPSRKLVEYRVAADFGSSSGLGSAERQSG